MIYTVTLNPSLDYLVDVEGFRMGHTNRTCFEKLVCGGKGINVSTVLAELGCETAALGFVAGFTGNEIRDQVKQRGIHADFMELGEGESRINVKMLFCEATEINAWGPFISEKDIEKLKQKLTNIKAEDTLVMGGGIPQGMTKRIYRELMDTVRDSNASVVVDAERDLLLPTLEHHPFLIKPNKDELEAIFEVQITQRRDIVKYADGLRELGARNVLVSLGGEGAVLLCETGELLYGTAPQGKVINTVGAGDSMIAGFLAGWQEKQDYEYAFRLGIAAGSATAFSKGLAKRKEIETVYENVLL